MMTADLTPVESRAWDAYQRVRAAIAHVKAGLADGVASPSEYWAEELGLIDYMADATPLIVRKLRHHAFWITGLRAYDYRVQDDQRRDLFKERLHALEALGGRDLVVPEAEALGGFGYRIDGGLYNLDTIKFLEVLVGMRLAGVYEALHAAERPVIVEVGGGWGGLAYQIKTLMPAALYVIIDLPELFVFSSVYLAALLPAARQVFWGVDANGVDAWRDADIVFVPNTLADAVVGFGPQAMLNVASFQEMTEAQVEGYVSIAERSRCPHLYSLNRDRSRYNRQLGSVRDVLGRRYRLDDVAVLDTDYTKAMKKPSRKKRQDGVAPAELDLSYRHIAGTLP
jgi:hypothetical protein